MHPIECLRSQTPVSHLYILNGQAPANTDLRLYNFANFQIATEGCATSTLLGQLWCSYEITLYKPILGGSTVGQGLLTDKFQLTNPTATNPLGASQVAVNNQLGGVVTATTYTFPPQTLQGEYLFVYNVVGSSASNLVEPLITVSTGLVRTSQWATAAGFDLSSVALAPLSAAGVNNAGMVMSFMVSFNSNIPAQPIRVTWGVAGTLPGGGLGNVFGDLLVTQVSPSVIN